MIKPVVLFDADGFLLDFHTPALAVASMVIYKATNVMTDIKPEDLPTWDIFDTVGKQYEPDCYLEYEKAGWCAAIKPYPEAVEGVRKAKELADVVVVTSPLHSPTWCHERTQALYKYFAIPRRDVIFAARKTLVKGSMLVDDNPRHVMEWAEANFDELGQGVLWNQPYNLEALVEGRRSYTRYAESWADLLDIIGQL